MPHMVGKPVGVFQQSWTSFVQNFNTHYSQPVLDFKGSFLLSTRKITKCILTYGVECSKHQFIGPQHKQVFYPLSDESKETTYILTIAGQTVRNDIAFVEAYKNPASNEFQALASETCGAVSTELAQILIKL